MGEIASGSKFHKSKEPNFVTKVLDRFPLGLVVIFVLSILSTLYLLLDKVDEDEGLVFWTFSSEHLELYKPKLSVWNEQVADPELRIQSKLIELDAIKRRMLSGVFSGTPLCDMMEITELEVKSVFRGPLEAVPFHDLTNLLKEEGIYGKINQPSFSPWISRGRIFGVPHDVHPVLLTYRADIIEAAGIDMEQVETWDDFFRVLEPLAKDIDGDGHIDRFPLMFTQNDIYHVLTLMMQAGCRLFDDEGKCILDSMLNARILAQMSLWVTEQNNWTLDTSLYGQGTFKRVLDGDVLAWITPDWMNYSVKNYISGLSGKVKLMPLPAWEPGGRRTSVLGGTMMGIPKTTEHFEAVWEVVKYLYCDRDIARGLYEISGIITPVNEFWDDPVFAEPDPFFCGQKTGLMYIEQAPYVPIRESSPYGGIAMTGVQNLMNDIIDHVNATGETDIVVLTRKMLNGLKEVRAHVESNMKRDLSINQISSSEVDDEG